MIPSDWQPIQLKDVVQKGRKICYGIVQPGDFAPDGIPLIRGKDYSFGWVPLENFFRVSEAIDRPYNRSKVKPRDLILTIVGAGTGNVATVPEWLDGANITQTTARIAVDHEKFDHRYVRALLQSRFGQNAVYRAIKGGAQPGLNIADVEKFTFFYPPKNIQSQIADAAEAWDRAIETVEALIANARIQKQALMQQLLPQGTTPPKKRLPGFSGEWREAKLGSLADISKGEQKGRASLAEEGPVPVINGGITPSGYTDHPNTSADTITISEGGNSCGYVDLITQPFWCGGHCYALKNLKIERDYLFAVLKHRERQIMSLRVGSGLPNIQKKALSQFSIPVPPKPEQVKIGELAASADREIAALEGQLTALRQEKAALMQQLLTGKRRVKLPESENA